MKVRTLTEPGSTGKRDLKKNVADQRIGNSGLITDIAKEFSRLARERTEQPSTGYLELAKCEMGCIDHILSEQQMLE